jgi:hypothetical protein
MILHRRKGIFCTDGWKKSFSTDGRKVSIPTVRRKYSIPTVGRKVSPLTEGNILYKESFCTDEGKVSVPIEGKFLYRRRKSFCTGGREILYRLLEGYFLHQQKKVFALTVRMMVVEHVSRLVIAHTLSLFLCISSS